MAASIVNMTQVQYIIKVWITLYDDNYHCELEVCIFLNAYDLTNAH